MRILGIDCGTAITGWSIIEVGSSPQLLDCGIIETHKLSHESDRLLDLGDSIGQLIDTYHPDSMAIEDIFFFKNAKTVIKVAQARGVVMYKAAAAKMEIRSYTPLQIKQRITGNGRAEKTQVQFVVDKIFSLNGKLKQDDTVDAVAAAYCLYLESAGSISKKS